jgi:hypothetical protein
MEGCDSTPCPLLHRKVGFRGTWYFVFDTRPGPTSYDTQAYYRHTMIQRIILKAGRKQSWQWSYDLRQYSEAQVRAQWDSLIESILKYSSLWENLALSPCLISISGHAHMYACAMSLILQPQPSPENNSTSANATRDNSSVPVPGCRGKTCISVPFKTRGLEAWSRT